MPGLPLGEIGADQAVELHGEVRRDYSPPWGGALQVAAFAQQGWVQQHKATWERWEGVRADPGNFVDVANVGLSAVQTFTGQWVLRAVVGRQVGGNPVRNPVTGQDSDGKTSRHRAWFQLIHYF